MVKVNITIILDISKMPDDLKKEWHETIEKLKKLPNVTVKED